MNVTTIELDKETAITKYKEYLEANKRRASKEYSAARRAYRALSKGYKVIDIYGAFEKTGVKTNGSGPKLAIVRADATEVLFIKSRAGGGRFCRPNARAWGNPSQKVEDVVIPDGTFPNWEFMPNSTWKLKDETLATNVPFIPAHIAVTANLKNYYILFEVDTWKKRQKVRDPYLLQRLNDNTFVVLAEWDVSPVEAIIMRGA